MTKRNLNDEITFLLIKPLFRLSVKTTRTGQVSVFKWSLAHLTTKPPALPFFTNGADDGACSVPREGKDQRSPQNTVKAYMTFI